MTQLVPYIGGNPVSQTNPFPLGALVGTPVNRSVTCTGSAQTAAAANTARRWLIVQNPGSNGGSIWFRLDGTAAAQASPAIELLPGQTWETSATFIPGGLVSVIGTAGLVVTVWEA